jgi:hypothetical protein
MIEILCSFRLAFAKSWLFHLLSVCRGRFSGLLHKGFAEVFQIIEPGFAGCFGDGYPFRLNAVRPAIW